MAYRHPQDPQTQWDAAATCGKLVAQGIIAAADVVPDLIAAAVRAGYSGDLSGLQTRMTRQVNDTAEFWRLRRDRTEWLIRRAIAPLLHDRAASAAILDTAQGINANEGDALLPREVRDLVANDMRAFLAQPRSRSRRDG